MIRIAAVMLLAIGVCAGATVDVLGEHFVTVNPGETLVTEYSTQLFYRSFGVQPTAGVLIGYGGGEVPTGPIVGDERWLTDTLFHVTLESLDGSISYDAGMFSARFYHFLFHSGGTILWEGDGFGFSTDSQPIADILATGGVRSKLTNIGVPLRLGDPIHPVFERTRLGFSFSDGGRSQGAGPATAAWLEIPDTPTPEPGTCAITACGIALAVAVRGRVRGRGTPCLR